jgi:hypothetical protein
MASGVIQFVTELQYEVDESILRATSPMIYYIHAHGARIKAMCTFKRSDDTRSKNVDGRSRIVVDTLTLSERVMFVDHREVIIFSSFLDYLLDIILPVVSNMIGHVIF